MPTPVVVGKRVEEIDLVGLFPANEGMITQYYGRIGSGKTYAATSDILEKLRRGNVVYANWRIHYEGTDERKSWAYILLGLIWPFKRRYYYFPKENLKYFEFSDKWAMQEAKPQGGFYKDFTEWLSTRTDCDIFGDEGHVMFDSYAGTRMSIDKRTAVLHTRHFNRSIHIISQRPTAVHVSMRANVNIFYRCEQIWSWGGFLVRFKRSEYQDMQGETVDEDEEKVLSVKYYWGKKRVFEAYDTKYLRGDMPQSDKVAFEAYDVGYIGKTLLLLRKVMGEKSSKPPEQIDKVSRPSSYELSTAHKVIQKWKSVVHSGYESLWSRRPKVPFFHARGPVQSHAALAPRPTPPRAAEAFRDFRVLKVNSTKDVPQTFRQLTVRATPGKSRKKGQPAGVVRLAPFVSSEKA